MKMNMMHAVASAVSAKPQRAAIHHLIDEGQRIALAYLYQKVRRKQLQPGLFGISLEDLALDVIAELFQREDDGRFPQLISYFSAASWQEMDEADLYISFRRLVFGKLNEGLFRRYGEADPSLAKLIRNIKNAIKATPNLSLLRRRELHLVVNVDGSGQPALNAAPLAPAEILEAFLAHHLHGCSGLLDEVALFAAFVERHPSYCNGYPLSGFAQVLRSAHVRLGKAAPEEPQEKEFLPSEVQRVLRLATREMEREMYKSYVGRGKVDAQLFPIYFCAIRDILAAQSLNEAQPMDSYFEALKVHLPALDKARYSKQHRNVLEYLTTLCRARMHLYLKEAARQPYISV